MYSFPNRAPVASFIIAAIAVCGLIAAPMPANAGTIPSCSARNLGGHVVKTQESMSHYQVDYEITNLSDTACFVKGAPSVAMVQPNQPVKPIDTGNTIFTKNQKDRAIILEPYQRARGEIAWAVNGSPSPARTTVVWQDPPFAVTLDDLYGITGGEHLIATNVHR